MCAWLRAVQPLSGAGRWHAGWLLRPSQGQGTQPGQGWQRCCCCCCLCPGTPLECWALRCAAAASGRPPGLRTPAARWISQGGEPNSSCQRKSFQAILLLLEAVASRTSEQKRLGEPWWPVLVGMAHAGAGQLSSQQAIGAHKDEVNACPAYPSSVLLVLSYPHVSKGHTHSIQYELAGDHLGLHQQAFSGKSCHLKQQGLTGFQQRLP